MAPDGTPQVSRGRRGRHGWTGRIHIGQPDDVRARELLVDELAVDDADAIDLDAIIAELSAMPVAGCPTCGGRITCHPMPASGAGTTRAPPGDRTP